LGLIATRSISKEIEGIHELVTKNKENIIAGQKAYAALSILRKDPQDAVAKSTFERYKASLGYGLLLKRYAEDVTSASAEQIDKAAWDTVPKVKPLFWAFRIMMMLGFWFIALFAIAFYFSMKHKLNTPWFLKLAFYSLPLPWVAIELGWFVAEYGRQPWVIDGILPTFMGVSSIGVSDVTISLVGFLIFYTGLAIVEMMLMMKYIRLGPES
jgi:cytochrome bd ubiquinol oxidase subunit I